MAKCTRCGRAGFFLKLTNGLCDNCISTIRMESEQAALQAQINEMSGKLSAQKALFESNTRDNQAELERQKEACKKEVEEAQKALQAQIAQMAEKLKNQEALFDLLSEKARLVGKAKAEKENEELTSQSLRISQEILNKRLNLDKISEETAKAEKSFQNAEQKVRRSRELLRAIKHAAEDFGTDEENQNIYALLQQADKLMGPTVVLNLQCLDIKELRRRYRENEKNIQATFDKYKDRYTTKANITIYRLMVIALSAELQNVLNNIGFGKLDDALADIKTITNKYYAIATDGNQSIAPTVKKFIGELDYYFQEAVKIEYEYYVQKERAREEQRAIREQMRQEAEERRELERQQKQIEKEESKFHDQISQLTQQVEVSVDDEKTALLKARIEELQKQLAAVSEQKEKIVELQNGKAGNVYVISNIGSFGEGVFKIGMTRRLEPMERVHELGSASVPFPFDVHSMIFSDDAVSLETKLHHILNDQRVNKVNLRKEFFRVSLDDLEKLVAEIAPTAEFKRTVLAEQYRQSLSITHVSDDTDTEISDDEEDYMDVAE